MYTKMLNILTSDLWLRELFLKPRGVQVNKEMHSHLSTKTYFDEALKRKIPSAV